MIRYLDTTAVARLLHVTEHRIRLLRSQGRLPPPDAMVDTRPLWLPYTIEFWRTPSAR